MFKKLLDTNIGRYILSALLGFGLATIFRKTCDKRNCLTFKAPDFEEIKDTVYKYDNKCYKFYETAVSCDPRSKIVEFE